MKKFYSIRKGIEASTVFDRLNKMLSSYGLSILYDGKLTATIHLGNEKVGYAWLGTELMVEIYPLFEERLDWTKITEELLNSLKEAGFLQGPLPIPEAPPIEVYHRGCFVGTVSILPGEPGLTPGEVVRLSQLSRSFQK